MFTGVVMNIRAVFFDFGNVLIAFDFRRFITKFATHTGVAPEAVHEVLIPPQYGYTQFFQDFECGLIGPGKFFHELTSMLGVSARIDFATFAIMWADIFLRENDALDALLGKITRQKFILSNINMLLYTRCMAECMLIKKHFPLNEQRILSYRVGAIKPNHPIYHHAFQRANVPPEECLFVDDRPENIAAWQALGGHGILYDAHVDSTEALEAKLEKFGVFA